MIFVLQAVDLGIMRNVIDHTVMFAQDYSPVN